MRIKRALVSVSEKRGLATLAAGLHELGVELVSTSGTAAFLSDAGLPVTRVEDITGEAELLDGRVKTLHPAIHAAVLARRDRDEDMRALEERGIEPIDLVVANLYPFRQVALRRDATEAEVIENIDIGGPAMVRAAAKNFRSVAVVVDPERYGFVLDELRGSAGSLSLDTRRELAGEAFAHCASYDIAVSSWFSEVDPFPERMLLDFVKVSDLPYGENPHQRAALYRESGARRHLLSMVEQHGGKPLSFNNLTDLQAARGIVASFQVPACAIVKHGNPCGAAVGTTLQQAFDRAYAADPLSAFGGVVAMNRPIERTLAERIAEHFVELVFAPGYDTDALAVLRAREGMRVLQDNERRKSSPGERDMRRVLGGLLVQDRDSDWEDRDQMDVVTETAPTERQWGDLLFAWRVSRFVRSNAIVIARDLATVGVGAGQMSRVDAVRLAVGKAADAAATGVLASDAFFPFADGVREACAAGVKALIQPGGSKRDGEVIAAANEFGVPMVFTGRRHFSH